MDYFLSDPPVVELRAGEVVVQRDVELPVVLRQAVQGRLLPRLGAALKNKKFCFEQKISPFTELTWVRVMNSLHLSFCEVFSLCMSAEVEEVVVVEDPRTVFLDSPLCNRQW